VSGQPEYPHRAFDVYANALRRRRESGGYAPTEEDLQRLLALRDRWDWAYQRDPGGHVAGVPGGLSVGAQVPPSREAVEAEFAPAPVVEDAPVPEGKRVGRRPGSTPIPVELAERLEVEIRQRRRVLGDERWTHGAIAARIEPDLPNLTPKARERLVQRAERLLKKGWPLIESDPEFLGTDGFVSWPNEKKALQLLRSGRVRPARPL
jgi:hypothetical protein